jgi:hypothetical protein
MGRKWDVFVPAPQILDFSKNYVETVEFLDRIRNLPQRPAPSGEALVDLTPVRELTPAVALCLVSEFDRWQRRIQRTLRPVTLRNWRSDVRAKLNGMGFFKLLNTSPPARFVRTSRGVPKWLRFTSGVQSDGSLARKLKEGLEAAVGTTLDGSWHAVYRPLIEAMSNAVEHAYQVDFAPEDERSLGGKRWWLSGEIDSDTERVSILFFDQGIGIARSVERTDVIWRAIGPLVRALGDGDAQRIAAAVAYGRSRTRAKNRGKGLGDILQLADLHPDNRLQIVSHSGTYIYSKGHEPAIITNPRPLHGTLIEWNLSLSNLRGLLPELPK